MKQSDAELLTRLDIALEVAKLADSYATMSLAHYQAASHALDGGERVAAAGFVGHAKAFNQVAKRLIALVEDLKG